MIATSTVEKQDVRAHRQTGYRLRSEIYRPDAEMVLKASRRLSDIRS
jgi:hypothetical protein